MNELEKYTTAELKAELARRHRIEVEERMSRPKWRYLEGVVTKIDGDCERVLRNRKCIIPVPVSCWRYHLILDKPVDSEGYEVQSSWVFKLKNGFSKKNAPKVGDRVRLRCWNFVKHDDNLLSYNNRWFIFEILEKHKVQG